MQMVTVIAPHGSLMSTEKHKPIQTCKGNVQGNTEIRTEAVKATKASWSSCRSLLTIAASAGAIKKGHAVISTQGTMPGLSSGKPGFSSGTC